MAWILVLRWGYSSKLSLVSSHSYHITKYSNKVVQLVGRCVVPVLVLVLATMILLSNTKIIQTVFQVFYYTNIQYTDENDIIFLRKVWKIDANVQYMKDHHLSLFVLLIIPYICFLFIISLFEQQLSNFKCCQMVSVYYMKPFFDSYRGPCI